jgi:hypothetical protein
MGPTKVVNIDSLVVNNAQDNLEIIKVESLTVNNFLFGSSFGLRSASVILSEIKSFTFSKTMLATSGNILFKIDNSNESLKTPPYQESEETTPKSQMEVDC